MAYLGNKYGIYADPSFQMGMALGNAYGNMWAHNAKQRQAKQLDDYFEEQANANLMAQVNAAQTNNYDLSKGATPMLDRLDGQRTSVDKILDNMSMATGGVEFIKSQADMNPVQRAKDRYKNLSIDNVTAWAKKNGINKEVLDERLPSLQKELATNVGAVMLPEITKNLYSGNVDNILTGMQQLDELKQYDPAAYERYSKMGDSLMANAMNRKNDIADYEKKLQLQNKYSGGKQNVFPAGFKSLSEINDRLAVIREMGIPEEFESEFNYLKGWKIQNGFEAPPAEVKQETTPAKKEQAEQPQKQVPQVNQDEVDTNNFNRLAAIAYARSKGIPTNIFTGLPEAQNKQQQEMLREIEAMYDLTFR